MQHCKWDLDLNHNSKRGIRIGIPACRYPSVTYLEFVRLTPHRLMADSPGLTRGAVLNIITTAVNSSPPPPPPVLSNSITTTAGVNSLPIAIKSKAV